MGRCDQRPKSLVVKDLGGPGCHKSLRPSNLRYKENLNKS
jgi:hypothetical protein